MKQLIACCGLDCEKCEARIATLNIVTANGRASLDFACEILSLLKTDEPQEIEMKAIKLSQEFSSVIVVTGPTDLVTDGHRVAHI